MTSHDPPIGESSAQNRLGADAIPGFALRQSAMHRILDSRGRWRVTMEFPGEESSETLEKLEKILRARGVWYGFKHLEPTRIVKDTEAMDFLAAFFEAHPVAVPATLLYAEAKSAGFSRKQLRNAKSRLLIDHVGGGAATRWLPPWPSQVSEDAQSIDELLGFERPGASAAIDLPPSALDLLVSDLESGEGGRATPTGPSSERPPRENKPL